MKNLVRIVSVVAVSVVALCPLITAGAADKLEGITLEWMPTSPMSGRAPVDLQGLERVRLRIEPFTDKRADPEYIGRNTARIPIRKVTTSEDVARFVTYQVKLLLSELGIEVVETGGNVVLKGEVRKFFVEEAKRYNAEVELDAIFTDTNGKMLWGVVATGTSSRFGISYKAANYFEVLSDALIGATHEMVHNRGFRKALAGN